MSDVSGYPDFHDNSGHPDRLVRLTDWEFRLVKHVVERYADAAALRIGDPTEQLATQVLSKLESAGDPGEVAGFQPSPIRRPTAPPPRVKLTPAQQKQRQDELRKQRLLAARAKAQVAYEDRMRRVNDEALLTVQDPDAVFLNDLTGDWVPFRELPEDQQQSWLLSRLDL